MKDLHENPRLQRLAQSGALAEYLLERGESSSETELIFVSQSGKPLSLANTYTVMERHKPQENG
jgi:hypothetical protein